MMYAEACYPCKTGLHRECYEPSPTEDEGFISCCCLASTTTEGVASIGRPVSEPSEIKDITSTGRKRAAMLYPVFEGMTCQWSRLLNAGGGPVPIIGCDGNTLSVSRGSYGRHHGPDKNVISNQPGNVHLVCMSCHNRWHAMNNEFYENPRPPADQPWLPKEEFENFPHDPDTQATDEQIEENEKWWATRKDSRVDTDD